MAVVAYQGEPGSYSEEAFWYRFAGHGYTSRGCHTFEEVAHCLVEGSAIRGILPIRNTVVGDIEDAVKVIEENELSEMERFWRRVDHCLIGHPDASKERVERVFSHPAALAQCASYLAGQGFEAVAAEDTAGAVREVKERGDPKEAAVASRRAAAIHGMDILDVAIQDQRDNRTQFAIIRA